MEQMKAVVKRRNSRIMTVLTLAIAIIINYIVFKSITYNPSNISSVCFEIYKTGWSQ